MLFACWQDVFKQEMESNFESAYPLHWLVWQNRTAVLESLLNKDEVSHKARSLCCILRSISCISPLIFVWNIAQGRRHIEQRDPRSRTPLHLAVSLGRVQCSQILLAKGADATAENGEHWSGKCTGATWVWTGVSSTSLTLSGHTKLIGNRSTWLFFEPLSPTFVAWLVLAQYKILLSLTSDSLWMLIVFQVVAELFFIFHPFLFVQVCLPACAPVIFFFLTVLFRLSSFYFKNLSSYFVEFYFFVLFFRWYFVMMAQVLPIFQPMHTTPTAKKEEEENETLWQNSFSWKWDQDRSAMAVSFALFIVIEIASPKYSTGMLLPSNIVCRLWVSAWKLTLKPNCRRAKFLLKVLVCSALQ